jgi:hypothetical protein
MGVQATPLLDKTYKASGDLSLLRYTAVRMTADYTVGGTTTNAQVGVGILQSEPSAAGQDARVRHHGTSIAIAGAAFAAGAKLTSDAQGRLIATSGAGQICHALALQAAGAANDQVEVLVTPGCLA